MVHTSSLPRGGASAGNLLLLVPAAADSTASAQGGMHKCLSHPSLSSTGYQHPDDHGLDVHLLPRDGPMLLLEQASSKGPDAFGVIMEQILQELGMPMARSAKSLPATKSAGLSTSLPTHHFNSMPWATQGTSTPASRTSSLAAPNASCQSMDDLPDDLLLSILSCLDPTHRHVASGTCERLLSLAQSTFQAISLALPAAPLVPAGAAAAAQAPASIRQNLAALPARRFDTIHKLELALPEVTDKRQLRFMEEPCHPLNAWLASYLTTGRAGSALESLKIQALSLPSSGTSPHAPAHSASIAINRTTTRNRSLSREGSDSDASRLFGSHSWQPEACFVGSQDWMAASRSPPGQQQPLAQPQQLSAKEKGAFVSGRALKLLATHCPALKELNVPLLAPGAADALPSLAGQISSFTCMVQGSDILDAALQLKALHHLRLSLHTNLLTCTFHLGQVEALAQIQGLRSLSLAGILLPDSELCWKQLSRLSQLEELRVSFPVPAEHLKYLPHLQVLQYPTFSSGHLSALSHLAGLRELRTRHAVSEGDILTLCDLKHMSTLQVDSVRLPPPPPPPPPQAAVPPPTGAATAQAVPATGDAASVAVRSNEEAVGLEGAAVEEAAGGQDGAAPLQSAAAEQAGVVGQQLVPASMRDAWLPEMRPPREPSHPSAYIKSHYSGLQLPHVTSLVLTGVHVYRGELGALFPNLATLTVAAVDAPRQLPAAAVPLPHLHSLAWPASHAVPQLLAAAPALTSLTLTSISSSTLLEAALASDPTCPPACKLQHLALVVQCAGQGLSRSRALRNVLSSALATPACSSLCSVTIKDVPAVETATRTTSNPTAKDVLFNMLPDLVLEDEVPNASPSKPPAGNLWTSPSLTDPVAATSSLRRQSIDSAHMHVSGIAAHESHHAAHQGWQQGQASSCSVDPHALAAAGKVVDEGLLQVVLATLPGLRSLRVISAGSLTCHGLYAAVKAASPHLEQVVVTRCPRVRRAAAEQLGAELGRPWLRVCWSP